MSTRMQDSNRSIQLAHRPVRASLPVCFDTYQYASTQNSASVQLHFCFWVYWGIPEAILTTLPQLPVNYYFVTSLEFDTHFEP